MKIEQCENKAEVKNAIKLLLKKSFLMKAKDKDLMDYLIIQENLSLINEYLDIIDLEAKVNMDLDVISLGYIGIDGDLPLIYQMSINEMKIFTCLLVLFELKVQEELVSPDCVKTNIKELKAELANRDLRLIPNNRMTTFQNALTMFARYNLIEFIDKEMKDEYSAFRILPSIMFAKDDEKFLQMKESEAENNGEMIEASEDVTKVKEGAWEK